MKLGTWLAGGLDAVKLAKNLNFEPDKWQREVLRTSARYVSIVAARQVGKSTVVAVTALHSALYQPSSVVLIFSPTDRQSAELFLKVSAMYKALGKPIEPTAENVHALRLENDSRIMSLPASDSGVRGFTAAMIIIDEAGYVPDALVDAVSPMLAVSGGRMIMMGTPNGQRGRFYEASRSKLWERYVVPASECPRISGEFLAQERERLGEEVFAQEYECAFTSAAGSAFRGEDIAAMLDPARRPAPAERTPRPRLSAEQLAVAGTLHALRAGRGRGERLRAAQQRRCRHFWRRTADGAEVCVGGGPSGGGCGARR